MICVCGNELGGEDKGFKVTRKPCLCDEPMPPRNSIQGLSFMRGAYKDPKRQALGLPDVTQDGGGVLKGTFWGE